MRNNQSQDGFSLIELLIVVTIIGIIASIAVPNILSSRRAANEASAQSSIRTIFSGQASYQVTAGSGAFAADLLTLKNANIIEGTLGSGTKSGYNFLIVEQAGTGGTAVFGARAIPVTTSGAAKTGARRFGLTEAGVLRGDTNLGTDPNTRALISAMAAIGN